jgi:hypothetical protein
LFREALRHIITPAGPHFRTTKALLYNFTNPKMSIRHRRDLKHQTWITRRAVGRATSPLGGSRRWRERVDTRSCYFTLIVPLQCFTVVEDTVSKFVCLTAHNLNNPSWTGLFFFRPASGQDSCGNANMEHLSSDQQRRSAMSLLSCGMTTNFKAEIW